MQKKESQNGGTEPENQGPESQSARAGAVETHFRISGKTRIPIEILLISPPFFSSFLTLFRGVSRKPEKGAQDPATEPQNHTKMDPKGAQTEPTNQQTEPQGSPQVRKTCKNKSPRLAKWSPKRYNGVAGPPKVQEKQKKTSQSANKT